MNTIKKSSRILLKLSGEMLGGDEQAGFSTEALELVAHEIADMHHHKKQVAVVVGGGNIFRGSLAGNLGMERAAADYMGMLATCINGLALQGILESRHQVSTRVMTAVHMPELAEPYIRRKAIKHLEAGRVVVFAGGTGNPFFTTDTAASLRALETNCEIILKATKVDGIYTSDPKKDPTAEKFQSLTYIEVISKNLKVMDATAITMCMEAGLPIKVFKMDEEGCVLRALTDPAIGTLVR
ncbi:MAG: UMP kinase [Oligoflexales bacterium]|nr:UMP kinase [Oligoflexales bacterium]